MLVVLLMGSLFAMPRTFGDAAAGGGPDRGVERGGEEPLLPDLVESIPRRNGRTLLMVACWFARSDCRSLTAFTQLKNLPGRRCSKCRI